jgi:hypothetical protein
MAGSAMSHLARNGTGIIRYGPGFFDGDLPGAPCIISYILINNNRGETACPIRQLASKLRRHV